MNAASEGDGTMKTLKDPRTLAQRLADAKQRNRKLDRLAAIADRRYVSGLNRNLRKRVK
jgi:hypothetical protein